MRMWLLVLEMVLRVLVVWARARAPTFLLTCEVVLRAPVLLVIGWVEANTRETISLRCVSPT